MVVLLLKIAILMHFGAKNRTDPGGTDVRDFANVPPSTKLPLAASPAFGPFHVPPAGSRFRPPLFPLCSSHESPMPESAIVASAASSPPPPLHRGTEGTEVANAQHEADLDYEREIDKAKARHRGCMLGVHKRCLRRGEAVGNEFYCNLHKN